MIELPYGIADYRTIRTQGMLYVDRTAHIRDVENLGRALVLLRPRRFGKSLWLQTLANYYDLRRHDEFDALFGNLAIARDGRTAMANRYFVLQWNFSLVDPSGDVEQIAARLQQHVSDQVSAFVRDYQGHLPDTVATKGSPATVLGSLLSVIRMTPYKLYLLIDEYDNFINEVMARDINTYRALVDIDGPFKQVFKAVKGALEGQGLERVFITGVSPLALNDLTSGFNVSENISMEPSLACLCGFRETEIEDLLASITAEYKLPPEVGAEALGTMRTWYNGYRFATSSNELVYNPTNVLYFLRNLCRHGAAPAKLEDENLRTDRGKLVFLARTAAGAGVIEKLAQGDGTIDITELHTSFSLDDLTIRLAKDRGSIASFLYYMGLLTLTEAPYRLRIPNLVVRKVFLDRLLELFLPDVSDSSGAQEIAMGFYRDGNLVPLLAFFEEKLLPVLSNRDRGAPARAPNLSGSGVNEMVIKTLFLSILFADRYYRSYSEPELARTYADLCLLVRPPMRGRGFLDLLFEFKLVRRKELGQTGLALADLGEAALRQLPPVARALTTARDQIRRYRAALLAQEPTLDLRSYVVVAVGLERILGEEVSG
jgi:hypothetical protein